MRVAVEAMSIIEHRLVDQVKINRNVGDVHTMDPGMDWESSKVYDQGRDRFVDLYPRLFVDILLGGLIRREEDRAGMAKSAQFDR